MSIDRGDNCPPSILHTVTQVGHTAYGPGRVALNLAYHQQIQGATTRIWCTDTMAEIEWAAGTSGLATEDIEPFACHGPAFLHYSPAMERAAASSAAQEYQVLHQHGIWTALSRVALRWSAVGRGPIVIAPHGSLEAWALKKSTWKKHLALLAYEAQNLRQAACLHALAESEAASFRRFGLRNPIAVIPNGISDAWLHSTGNAVNFRHKCVLPESTHLLLFLGRITPKKGLTMLLQAMALLREKLADWQLIIAGADEFGHQSELKHLIDRLGLAALVRFIGPLFDQDKRDAFAAADVFVLPSHSEGAPLVILEALGAGVPVLATKGSPWSALAVQHCGWWVDIRVEALADALSEALDLTPEELREMGERGRGLVARDHHWSRIAAMTLSLYQWLLGRADWPDFVVLD